MTADIHPVEWRRRLARAALAFLVAWAVAGVSWALWTRPWIASPVGGTGWDDLGVMLLFAGGFALLGWIVVVLPIVRFGSHRGWFFRVGTAPFVGFVCGVGILLAEYAAFFGYPPWRVWDDLADPGVYGVLLMAGVFGAALWWTYTWSVRRD